MPSAAPAVLLHSLHTQQGVCNIVTAMTRRDFVKPAFSLRYAPWKHMPYRFWGLLDSVRQAKLVISCKVKVLAWNSKEWIHKA